LILSHVFTYKSFLRGLKKPLYSLKSTPLGVKFDAGSEKWGLIPGKNLVSEINGSENQKSFKNNVFGLLIQVQRHLTAKLDFSQPWDR